MKPGAPGIKIKLPGFWKKRVSGLFVPRAATAWAAALLMLVDGMAIFLNGAYFIGPMTFCVVGSWLIFAMLIIAGRHDEIWLTRRAITMVAVLALFWAWVGVSLSWSIASDLTWVEFNRTGGFFAAFVIGVAVGRQKIPRLIGAWTFFFMASAASLYSLAPKVLPSVVDNLENLSRTSIPLGYANALGLLIAMAVPLALYFSATVTLHPFLRLFAAMMAPLLLVSLFFTISRGAILALIIGLIVYFSVSPVRLRSFGMLVLALIPAALIAWWSSGQDALMENQVDRGERMIAAVDLRIFLVTAVLSVAAIYLVTLAVGGKVIFPRKVSRFVGLAILISLTITILVSSLNFISSKPSFSQWVNDEYEAFTALKLVGPTDATRLLDINSSVRWQLWREAIANWNENRLTGTGGQSFPVVHMLKQENGMPFVKQPHGLPFQLLTELGVIGFTLLALFIIFTLSISLWILYRIKEQWEPGLAAALFSLIIIYLVHTSFDWDWNMFALTLPYFFFTGILVGWPASSRSEVGPEEDVISGSMSPAAAELESHGLRR